MKLNIINQSLWFKKQDQEKNLNFRKLPAYLWEFYSKELDKYKKNNRFHSVEFKSEFNKCELEMKIGNKTMKIICDIFHAIILKSFKNRNKIDLGPISFQYGTDLEILNKKALDITANLPFIFDNGVLTMETQKLNMLDELEVINFLERSDKR